MPFENLFQVKQYIEQQHIRLAWRNWFSGKYCVAFESGDSIDIHIGQVSCLIECQSKQFGYKRIRLNNNGKQVLLRLLDNLVAAIT